MDKREEMMINKDLPADGADMRASGSGEENGGSSGEVVKEAPSEENTKVLAAEEIMDRLMDWIMDGTLEMGDRLNTERIARELGISRMPVRSALAALEQAGLAYTIPYAGMRLVELSDEEVLEIYRIRQLLEPEAAYAACRHAGKEDLAAVEKAFYEHVAAISAAKVSPKEVHKKNRAFHFAIFRASHMNHLCKMIEELWDKLSFVKMLYGESFLSSESKRSVMIEEHRRYLEYLRNGEAEAIKGAVYMNIDDRMRKYRAQNAEEGKSL